MEELLPLALFVRNFLQILSIIAFTTGTVNALCSIKSCLHFKKNMLPLNGRVTENIKNTLQLKINNCRVYHGAGYEARTRHLLLGKQTLYRMS